MIARRRPTPVSDGNVDAIPLRLTPYGELVTVPMGRAAQMLADEGSYFTVINPTLGTGLVTLATPTADDDTKPFIVMRNNDVVGGKRIFPDYIRLTVTAAGTAGASLHATVKLDNINRYTSGSTLTTTPQNVNMASGEKSIALVYAGPLVAPAASAAQRVIAHVLARIATIAPVVGDEYLFKFGMEAAAGSGVKGGTAVTFDVFHLPPVAIGPGDSMLFHLYLPSQSAHSDYEVEMGYYER